MRHKEPSLDILRQRAVIIRSIRDFFLSRKVMEVDVPIIGAYSVSDPYLDALSLELDAQECFLQTSPEYFMKRLLARGSGDIFYLGKAFRKDEEGRFHNPEFTMLEWYRCGFDDKALMAELSDLIRILKPETKVEHLSYRDAFVKACGVDPHSASVNELKSVAAQKLDVHWSDAERNIWLDLLFTHLVEPDLKSRICFVYDFPASQCALSKVNVDDTGANVAKRFELYWHGVELANGYWELTDVEEQLYRFNKDNEARDRMGKKLIAADKDFIAAMKSGLPECAGVALGVDRLVMMLLDLSDIHEQSISL